MKQSWLIIVFLYACANPIPPTGGPKDLDPPVLLNTVPVNKTLNFDGREISLEFDEYIKEENLLTQLRITPGLRDPYTYKLNRNKITLSFEESFDSATTYTFNFREGLKDITEGNVPPNLKFVFSTGNFLDSASVHGVVRSYMTKELLEDITLSLYNEPDTITIFDGPPRYSTLTGENGVFSIENIKNGSYSMFSLDDKNKNLKLESRTEGYGYLDSLLILNDSVSGFELFILNLDTRPIVLQNSRPVNNNYDLKFNKPLKSYQLMVEEDNFVSNLVDDNQTLRIYHNTMVTDSLALRFIVEDSLQQSLDSMVYVKFEESTKKADKLTTKFSLNNGPVNKFWEGILKFNKPVQVVNYDSIYFQFDSLYSLPINSTMVSTNYSQDELTFTLNFAELFVADSIHKNWPKSFEFFIAEGSIISVESDSVTSINREFIFVDAKETGIIRGTIISEFQSFNLQLVDNKFQVIEEVKVNSHDIRTYEFPNITPGTYSIRVLIDENNNGIWDPGNIYQKILPEKVYLFFHPNVNTERINLRANWEQSGLELSF